MGNGNIKGEKKSPKDKSNHLQDNTNNQSKTKQLINRKSTDNLIFYACTDKASVITEILEERGWSRTRDGNVTNFTIKWCLEHQVDWKQFQEGKQLINNIPGQITFADKVNLWYTVRDYLNNRRNSVGNHIQSFLPMTFILDNEDEVAEFVRAYKKQNRTWIYKPRYSYAGQGIHVISVNSDLDTIFKLKLTAGNRIQHQPKTPGYLIQEYISRPLLIKGRKFDIRVHWLVAWTKPLLVFYNHHASVIRLSLNLYREFDFDRATHLTNLSVQENHFRYAFSQEATGMTMQQLNHYFNQCFRPFHPKMCQDWIMTVLQDRMQTIIRQVVRASKDKLERKAGYFGLFGCDFLLDENFRLWLLEVNDNPGVGWGNTQVNTTTKPLFEETFDIILECFNKSKRGRSLLPMECLKNYQLIYNENNDVENLQHDDNQVFSERLPVRHIIRDSSSRSSFNRTLPQISPSQATTIDSVTNSDPILPTVSEIVSTINIPPRKPRVPIQPVQIITEKERLAQLKALKAKYTFSLKPRSVDKSDMINLQRSLSSANTCVTIPRRKRVSLRPIHSNKKHKSQQSQQQQKRSIIPPCTEISKKEYTLIMEESRHHNENTATDIEQNINGNSSDVSVFV